MRRSKRRYRCFMCNGTTTWDRSGAWCKECEAKYRAPDSHYKPIRPLWWELHLALLTDLAALGSALDLSPYMRHLYRRAD